MRFLAKFLPKARTASPLVFSIRRPAGMSFITFAILSTFAYRTLNGKGFLGRALTKAAAPSTPRPRAKRLSNRTAAAH